MSDDPGYDEDFSEDYRIEEAFARFKEEHGAEVAQEDLNSEVLYYVASAHAQRWTAVRGEIENGRRRFEEGNLDEGVFHVYRAMEDYIKNVLSNSVREVFVARFNRSLAATEKTQEDLFKAVRGAGGAMDFALLGVAVLASGPEEREEFVTAFESFKKQWKRRNELFHNVVHATEADVQAILDFANGVFGRIAQVAETISAENARRKREYELQPLRVILLVSLSSHFDKNAERFLEQDEIGCDENPVEIHDALHRLYGENYVERGGSALEYTWRLTPAGRRHLREDVLPNIVGGTSRAH